MSRSIDDVQQDDVTESLHHSTEGEESGEFEDALLFQRCSRNGGPNKDVPYQSDCIL